MQWLKTIVGICIDPIYVLCFLLVALVWLVAKKKWKWAKRIGIGYIGLFLLFATPFLPDALVKNLESQYEPLIDLSGLTSGLNTHILVLGGGHTSDSRRTALDQLSQFSLSRVTEGARLQQIVQGSTLICSGYAGQDTSTNAELMATAAHSLGVDASAIEEMPEPRNTREEAIEYKKKFGTDHPLILVTSALHMPRAMTTFRTLGFDPIAAPTGHLYKPSKSYSGFLSGFNFYNLKAALHEYIGILYYQWTVKKNA